MSSHMAGAAFAAAAIAVLLWMVPGWTPLIAAQSLALSSANGGGGDHTHIEMIDVMCDAGADAMEVTIAFAAPFAGLVYSRGFFSDPRCRYVPSGGPDRVYTFRVPLVGCGSRRSCSLCASVDNVLVVQSDEAVQVMWDVARKVSCTAAPGPGSGGAANATALTAGTAIPHSDEKTIIFRPFVVEQLEVVSVPTAKGGVDCWMDIQRGRYPSVQPLVDSIRIGETLSVLVFLRDPKQAYDLIVRDCYAFDAADYEATATSRLQLSDKRGCSRKRQLFGAWQRLVEQREAGPTLVLHNALSAFKFPDRAQVFLKCEVEICRGECERPDCEASANEVTTEASPRRRGTRPPTIASPTFTTEIAAPIAKCERGSRHPECFQRSSPAPFSVAACQPGSRDRRCRGQSGATRVPTTSEESHGETATTEQGSSRTTTEGPTYLPPSTTDTTVTTLSCQPGSRNPRCRGTRPSHTTTPAVTDEPPTIRRTRRPQPFTANPTVSQTRRTLAPRPAAETTTQPIRARDPPQGRRTTTSGPTYLPPLAEPTPSTTSRTPSRCYPGSLDPECETPTTSIPRTTTTTSRTPTTTRRFVSTTTPRPDTTTGFARPETTTQTVRPETTTRTTRPESPTTTELNCRPGSRDRRCPTAAPITTTPTTVPTTTAIPTTNRPNCFPGSSDPRCPTAPPTTSTSAPDCYPGSRDPRCPRAPPVSEPPRTTGAPRCYPGSLDPRCMATSTVPTTKTTTRAPSPRPAPTETVLTRAPPTNAAQRTSTAVPPTIRPNCDDLSHLDPRCSRLEPATYLPPFPDTPSTQPATPPPPRTPTTTPAPRTPTTTRPTPTTTQPPRTRPTLPTYAACPPGSRSPSCPQPESDFEGPEYLPPFRDPLPAESRPGRQLAQPPSGPQPRARRPLNHGLADEINQVFAERRRHRRSLDSVNEAELTGETITFAISLKGYEIGRRD